MNAPEQWKRLNRAINVKHYIGPNAHKCIEDAIEASAKEDEPKKAPLEPVKGTIKIDKSKLGKKV
jgi:hypothetical protein